MLEDLFGAGAEEIRELCRRGGRRRGRDHVVIRHRPGILATPPNFCPLKLAMDEPFEDWLKQWPAVRFAIYPGPSVGAVQAKGPRRFFVPPRGS